MAYNTFRKNDMNVEQEVANYLDKYLYSRDMFTQAERTDDANNQINGSDIIISIPDKNLENIVVDEKAAIYYVNKNLQTFALELSFLNSGLHYSEGWFVNTNLATEYYLIQWLNADIDDPWQVKENNITEIECVLVSKAKLKEYFANEGYDKTKFLQIAQKMRASNQTMIAPPGKPYRFYYTQKLAEKPVNLLLSKEEYIRLSEFHYFVRPNGNN